MASTVQQPSFMVARGRSLVQQAAPVVEQAGKVLDVLEPVIRSVYEVYQQIAVAVAPFHLEELLPALYGLILCFFGGTYMMVTSAMEAFRLFGYEKVRRNVKTLHANFLVAREALRKDSLVDANRDGVADVKQMEGKERLSRQLGVFMQSVNPDEVYEALEGLLQGWFCVVATLKTRFAQYIAIGSGIGDSLNKLVGPTLTQIFQGVVPNEYDRWVPGTIRYAFRIFGVAVSWYIARVINSFYSSLRGAEIFLVGFTAFVTRRGIFNASNIDPGTVIFTILYTLLAGSGFLFQFLRHYRLPFPFNVLLFPVTILETFLTWAVAINKEVAFKEAAR